MSRVCLVRAAAHSCFHGRSHRRRHAGALPPRSAHLSNAFAHAARATAEGGYSGGPPPIARHAPPTTADGGGDEAVAAVRARARARGRRRVRDGCGRRSGRRAPRGESASRRSSRTTTLCARGAARRHSPAPGAVHGAACAAACPPRSCARRSPLRACRFRRRSSARWRPSSSPNLSRCAAAPTRCCGAGGRGAAVAGCGELHAARVPRRWWGRGARGVAHGDHECATAWRACTTPCVAADALRRRAQPSSRPPRAWRPAGPLTMRLWGMLSRASGRTCGRRG